ncbi:MAG: hypothetical protein LRZ91_01945 [Desulfotomaculum sp.]|nr:hypothetical protein [Desulfotomaculum sp.]
MGLFDKIKKAAKKLSADLKKDDFLMDVVDQMLQTRWKKISEKKSEGDIKVDVASGKIGLADSTEKDIVYEVYGTKVYVELEHEYPYLEIEVKKGLSGFFDIGRNEYYRKLKIDDFVEVVGDEFRLKNADILENEIDTLMKTVERKIQSM